MAAPGWTSSASAAPLKINPALLDGSTLDDDDADGARAAGAAPRETGRDR